MNRAYERWTCPRCGHGIDLRITPVVPPTCDCRPGKTVTAMQVTPPESNAGSGRLDSYIREPGNASTSPALDDPLRRSS